MKRRRRSFLTFLTVTLFYSCPYVIMDPSIIIVDLESSSSTFEQVDEQKDTTIDHETKDCIATSKKTTETPKQLQHETEILYQCHLCNYSTRYSNLLGLHKGVTHPGKGTVNPQSCRQTSETGSQENISEENIVKGKNQKKKKIKDRKPFSDDEKILLLQLVSKLQLNKYDESMYAIKKTVTNKWTEVSKIFIEKGYDRRSEELGIYFLKMKYAAKSKFESYYVKKCAVRPTKEDYILANLFPKFYESLGFDMSQLMTDAKTYSKEIQEYLVPVEDQERPTILEDIASLSQLNDVEAQPNLKRPHSEEAEGPSNKITKEVHEDEGAWLKRMLDITRGRNNCEAAISKSLINENNSSTDAINALKAKLLVAENETREKDHQLKRKNLEISYLKELHAKEIEIEKVKLLLHAQNVANKN
uniref:Uncharacterized protein LOC114337374 isoform X1 n=2 Tax=Diabrotica virgifera virgifera TaxID=50390 RepID=A0A6P7GF16_DIAVI